MNKKKKHRFDKLRKSSILFTQLGLVLALLIVYLSLEYTTVKNIAIPQEVVPDNETAFVEYDIPIVYAKKKNTVKKQPINKKFIPIIDIKTGPDDSPATDQVLAPPIDADSPVNFGSITEVIEDIDKDERPLPFRIIEEAPIYPGCEGLDSLASKQCFSKKISKFVNKKFNADLADRLNIAGKQRIWVQFTVDKTGTVTDIKARASHKNLEKEAIRVVNKLPQMTPGKQRKRPVGVKYTLPIVFSIK